MGTISKNFSYSEFERSETAEKKGIVNVIATAKVRDSIQALVVNVLQPLRTALGVEMPVNSGMKGEAADIATPTPLRMARKAVEMKLPFDQMGIYPTFVHFSHKLGGPQRGQIFYSKDYKGERL